MNSRHLTWLARAVICTVVLSTLWLADAAHQAELATPKPHLVAGSAPPTQSR